MHISTRVLPICLLSLVFGFPVAKSAHAQQETAAADTTGAAPQEESASGDTTAVQPGVQGAPNPMQDNVRLLVGQDLIDEAFPNSIPIPGTEVRFKIGGYAKLDYIQDFDPIGSRYEFESATIPVEGTPEAELGGRTTLHAKETRFNFDVRTVVTNEHYGWTFPLRVFMEWDFFEDNPDLFRQPRLRQAFGVVGRFLAGQTWSINADLEALPGNIDFGGGDGVYGDRVAQIRWQDKLGERFRWTVGVEEPKSQIANPFDLDGSSRQTLPNFAGQLRWTSAGGTHLQVGADLFQLRWQGGETGPDATAMGFGVNLTGRILLDSNNTNTILFGTSTGLGSSHRVLLLEFEPNDAVVTADDGLDVTSHWQGYAGFSHYWNESFNSTVSLYYARLNNSEFQSGDNIHDGGTFHINLIWFPYKYVSTGIEYMRGLRRNKDGAEGTANRVQLMAKFKIP